VRKNIRNIKYIFTKTDFLIMFIIKDIAQIAFEERNKIYPRFKASI